MSTKTSVVSMRRTKSWAVAIGLTAVYTSLYVGAWAITIENGNIGNFLLGILSIVGVGVSLYVIMTLHDIFGPPSWELLWTVWRWTAGVLAVAVISHMIGAFFMSGSETLLWFACSPLVVFVLGLFLRFVRYLMETKKLMDAGR